MAEQNAVPSWQPWHRGPTKNWLLSSANRRPADPCIPATNVDHHVGKEVTLIGWLLTEKIVSTKKGKPMEFMTLEDQSGMYDATVFPNTYREYCHLLAPNQAYVVTGLVEEQFCTVTVTVRTLRLLRTHAIETAPEPIEEVNA